MVGRHSLAVTVRALPAALAARASAVFDLRMPDERPVRAWLPPASEGADAILCVPGLRFDAALIGALARSVRVIGTFSVGVDHIDLAAARARGIAVVNTPGVLSQSTAEFTMLLLLAAARRCGEAERLVRAGRWQGASAADFLGMDVSGKRLGIFGMGRIGQALARIARGGFGMEIHYQNRSRLPAATEAGAVFHEGEDSFLAASQMLCLLAPGGPATEGWLNAARLAKLPAALDVFPREPHVPEIYLGLENIVLTPHIATATVETRDAMSRLVLDGIGACLAGERPDNLVA